MLGAGLLARTGYGFTREGVIFIVFTDLVNVIEKKIRPIYALWCLRAMSG